MVRIRHLFAAAAITIAAAVSAACTGGGTSVATHPPQPASSSAPNDQSFGAPLARPAPAATPSFGGTSKVTSAYTIPAPWQVQPFGVQTDNGYAAFEVAKPSAGGTEAPDVRELWILRLSDGAVRRIPALEPYSTSATDSISGGWLTHVEKTPRPDNECVEPSQGGCWNWKIWTVSLPSGTPLPMTQSTHTQNQLHVPLVSSRDGVFAWQQGAATGDGFELEEWNSAQPFPPHKLLAETDLGTVHVDAGNVYLEKSTLEKDGSRSDSTVSLVNSDGSLKPLAHYRGPCCVDIRDGTVAYMTGDRGGDGAVSTARLDQSATAALDGTAPAFRGLGIYWSWLVDARHVIVATVKGDYLVDVTQPAAPLVLTPGATAHIVIRPAEGVIAGVATTSDKQDMVYVMTP